MEQLFITTAPLHCTLVLAVAGPLLGLGMALAAAAGLRIRPPAGR